MRFTLTDIDNNNNTNKLMRRLRVLQKAASRGRRLSPTYCMTDWLAFHMEDAASGSFFRELLPECELRKNALLLTTFEPLFLSLSFSFFPGSLLSRLFSFRDLSFPLYTLPPHLLPTRSPFPTYLPGRMRSYLPGEDISPNLTGRGNFDSCSKISPIICVQGS
jgi:hypothetical protein